MFDTKHVPCYLEGMGHKTLKIGKDRYKGTMLTLRIDPLTPELAAELEAVKGICFRRNDAEVNPHINAVHFTLKPRVQRFEVTGAEGVRPSVTIPEAKIAKVRVRKPSDGSQWVLVFQVVFAEVGATELLYLKDALFEQRLFTFQDAQGGLFQDAEAEARRESREAKPVKPSAASSDTGVTAH